MTGSGYYFIYRFYLFIFRGGWREKERQRNTDVLEIHRSVVPGTPTARDLAGNPGACFA